MFPMTVLVVGRGWTGNKIYNRLRSLNHKVDLVSHDRAVTAVSSWKNYDWVVNCAGVTGFPNVDACENNKTQTIVGNAVFPVLLEQACFDNHVRFAHFSSGCIYTGNIDSADAEPNFFGSIYSISKGVSDVYLKDKSVVFRVRMPFTGKWEAKNYLTKVYNYAKNAKLIDSGQNSLTDLDEAVAVACTMIEDQVPNGAYNLVNSGSVNMHELAEIMKIEPEWFTPEEFKAATAAGRSTCVIPDCGKMRPIKEALKEAVENMRITGV